MQDWSTKGASSTGPHRQDCPLIRNAEVCYRSSSLAVEPAKRHGTRLHVLHLTSAYELALLEDKPLAQKRITA